MANLNDLLRTVNLFIEQIDELNFEVAIYKDIIKKLVNSESQLEILKEFVNNDEYWETEPDDSGVNSGTFFKALIRKHSRNSKNSENRE